MTEVEIPTLASMTPRAQNIALAFFEAGVVEGIRRGRAELEAEEAAAWAVIGAQIAACSKNRPLAVLAERRGDHAHAARVRARQRANGVVA